MHRSQAHLGAVAHQNQHEGRLQPGARQIRGLAHQIVEKERRFDPSTQRCIGQKKGPEQGQANPHGADEKILPGRFQRPGRVIKINVRRHRQGRRFHSHPHET